MRKRKRKLYVKGDPIQPDELVSWRRRLDWTQQEAADWLGVSVRSIENWEQGYKLMRHPDAMRKLMDQAKPRRRSKPPTEKAPQNKDAP